MRRSATTLLNDLSTTDLKRLLAARKRIDVLEGEKAKLEKELARIDRELAKLMADAGGASASGTTRRTKGRKKTAKKKAARKKTARTKTAKKTAKMSSKKTARAATRTKAAGGRAAGKRMTLEDVIAKVVKRNKGPVAVADLRRKIVRGKLFTSKSKDFDNVLRRTLSTSKRIKRVGRGLYDLA